MRLTYHHYGATVIDTPTEQLWRDVRDVLMAPERSLRSLDSSNAAQTVQGSPTFQIAGQSGDRAMLEEAIDASEGTHTFAYRASGLAPEIEQYVAICTLKRLAEVPGKSFVEWTREYHPAGYADRARSSAFAASLLDLDQALAANLAAASGGAEVLLIDYTLGSAEAEGSVSNTANRFTS